MKKILTVIEVLGWTESAQKGLISLWNGHEIETQPDHFEDFDFGDNAEQELKKAEEWIKNKAVVNDWRNPPVAQVTNYEYYLDD